MKIDLGKDVQTLLAMQEKKTIIINEKEEEINQLKYILNTEKLRIDGGTGNYYIGNFFIGSSYTMMSSSYGDYFLSLDWIENQEKILCPIPIFDRGKWTIGLFHKSKYDAINDYGLQPMLGDHPDQTNYTPDSYAIGFFKTVNIDLGIEDINIRIERDIDMAIGKLQSELNFLRK